MRCWSFGPSVYRSWQNDEADQLLQQCHQFFVNWKKGEMTQRAPQVLEKLVELSS